MIWMKGTGSYQKFLPSRLTTDVSHIVGGELLDKLVLHK